MAAMSVPWACPSGFWPAGLSSWLNSGPASLLQSCLATTGLRLVLAIVTGHVLFLLLTCRRTAPLSMHHVLLPPSAPGSPFLAEQPSLPAPCHFPPTGNIRLWGNDGKICLLYHISTLAFHLPFILSYLLIFFFNFSLYAYLCGCSLMFFHEALVVFSFLNTDSLSFLLFFLHLLVFWLFLHSTYISYNILSVFPAFSLSGTLNFLHFIECETVWASVYLWKVLRDGLCITCLVLVFFPFPSLIKLPLCWCMSFLLFLLYSVLILSPALLCGGSEKAAVGAQLLAGVNPP